jgi:hypothetical protein
MRLCRSRWSIRGRARCRRSGTRALAERSSLAGARLDGVQEPRRPHGVAHAKPGRPHRLRVMRGALVASAGLGLAGRGIYRLVARGELTLDTGIGRRLRRLGPVDFAVAAPRELVFNVIATPSSAERRERCRTSWPFGSAAPTWCSPPISPRSSAVGCKNSVRLQFRCFRGRGRGGHMATRWRSASCLCSRRTTVWKAGPSTPHTA